MQLIVPIQNNYHTKLVSLSADPADLPMGLKDAPSIFSSDLLWLFQPNFVELFSSTRTHRRAFYLSHPIPSTVFSAPLAVFLLIHFYQSRPRAPIRAAAAGPVRGLLSAKRGRSMCKEFLIPPFILPFLLSTFPASEASGGASNAYGDSMFLTTSWFAPLSGGLVSVRRPNSTRPISVVPIPEHP